MFLPRVVRFPARGFIKRQVSLQTVAGHCGPGNRPRRATRRKTGFENSIRRAQTGCNRAKKPPQYCSTLRQSIFAEWGLKQRILGMGCSE